MKREKEFIVCRKSENDSDYKESSGLAKSEQENVELPNQCLWMEETGRCKKRLPVGVHYCPPHEKKKNKVRVGNSRAQRKGDGLVNSKAVPN